MPYSIKKHEVDRLMNVAVVLGWELIEENYLDKGVEIKIRRTLSDELLALDAKIELPSSPQ
jgi:hypothetical protein